MQGEQLRTIVKHTSKMEIKQKVEEEELLLLLSLM